MFLTKEQMKVIIFLLGFFIFGLLLMYLDSKNVKILRSPYSHEEKIFFRKNNR